MHARARLLLYVIADIQTSWVSWPLQVQVVLGSVANHLGGILMEETISRNQRKAAFLTQIRNADGRR